MRSIRTQPFLLSVLLLASMASGLVANAAQPHPQDTTVGPNTAETGTGEYVVLAWNDLGMHCYNPSFRDIGVLPPWNTLWAQVILVGDPPQVVSDGITVTFAFDDNTDSASKSDFWEISDYQGVQNAQWLFDLPSPLPANKGLTGTGLAGEMEAHGGYLIAEGIPLTEYRDSAPGQPYPYQLATIIARDAASGAELARTTAVAPVSTEMHCDHCHDDNGPGNEDTAEGVVEQNILREHDEENMEDYPSDLAGPLMDRRPVLCAWCHASNALNAPGRPGIPNLSRALHDKHADEDDGPPSTLEGCYECHPGPQTQCLRDVMSTQNGMDCIDCHGTLAQVAQNPNPWLNEPRCDSAGCHGSSYPQDQALYRLSKGHGGIYCAACHDSPHAIAPSREANDALKFIGWQGHNGPLDTCTVCHASPPTGEGPHGLTADPHFALYLPLVLRR